MRLLKISKDTRYPKSDLAFDDVKKFYDQLPYLYPKIQGQWIILIVEPKPKEIEELFEGGLVPDYLDVRVYARPDVVSSFVAKYPKFAIVEKSKWEAFNDILADLDRVIEDKAAKALYRRCHGSTEMILERLEEIKKNTVGAITFADVDKYVLEDKVIYARDVMFSIWVSCREDIPRKGHILSRYVYMNPDKTADSFVSNLGTKYAFYALRKYIRRAYKDKLRFLDGKDPKDRVLCECIDVDTCTHAYAAFELSNPDQLYVVLEALKGRREDARILTNTLLKHYAKHNVLEQF